MDLFFNGPSYSSANSGMGDTMGGGSGGRLEADLRELELRLDRMSLACQALWELLEKHTELDEKHLQDKMSEIDLRDGSRDNKIAMTVLVCPNCGRRSNSRRQRCIFCGRTVPSKHVFG